MMSYTFYRPGLLLQLASSGFVGTVAIAIAENIATVLAATIPMLIESLCSPAMQNLQG